MIREYKAGEHPSGFVGLRVAVTVNKKQLQKYFSFYVDGVKIPAVEIEKIREEAKILEATWKEEAKKSKEESLLKRESVSDLVIAPNLRLYVKTTKTRGVLYANPAFITQAQKNFCVVNSSKTFGSARSGRSAKEAFEEILEDYQMIYTLTDRQKEKLIARAKQFRKKKKIWLEAIQRISGMTPELLKKLSNSFDAGFNNWD